MQKSVRDLKTFTQVKEELKAAKEDLELGSLTHDLKPR